jgi:tetratricopeptide (TPR) repeat protein
LPSVSISVKLTLLADRRYSVQYNARWPRKLHFFIMARKKRRFEQLQQAAATPKEKQVYINPLHEKVVPKIEEAGKVFEGKSRQILYAAAAVLVLGILVALWFNYSKRTEAAAQTALGKAIETSQAQINEAGPLAGSTQKSFKSEKERAEAAISEFEAVANNYGGAVAEKAKYFIAVNRLFVDRAAAISELESISQTNSPSGKMAKFALAQTRIADGRYDDAVTLLRELDSLDDPIVSKETIKFELAKVLEKQGKTDEAADIYFEIAKAASELKDADGKPKLFSDSATEAKKRLEEIAPDRAKEIVEPTPENPFGGMPGISLQ